MANVFVEPDGATPIDPDEINGLKFSHVQTRDQLNELEQANILSGLAWLRKQKDSAVLSESFVRELHERLFGDVWEWAGQFRLTEKNIGCDPIQISVQLRNLIDDTRYWIEYSVFPDKEIAARFHHRLVQIHPFPNGNGRHSRIMADAVLTIILGGDPIDWTGGHSLDSMTDRRKKYIEALRSADAGDYSAIFDFVGAA